MAGIYIHIPFCKQACHYCNFHFATSLRLKNELMTALLKEIELQKNYLANQKVDTIYFGGGTPSLCTKEELNNILQTIQDTFSICSLPEITLEANPDDITSEALLSWKQIGINRLSIGIQSFFDDDLLWMNRAHTASQAIEHLKLATAFFNNITIDLIYGSPGLTDEKWQENVETAISLGIPHLSCYALTIEPRTPLDKMIRTQQSATTDPDKQTDQFLQLMQWMGKAGYEHYEISNFAKPGSRSRHNSSYWQGSFYLGIGPSAHSFNGKERQWNIANNRQYIDSLQKNEIPFEKEILTDTQQLNEYIMTSLRTMEGINLEKMTTEKANALLINSEKYIRENLLIYKHHTLVLTAQGKTLADGIAANLFF